MDNKDLIISDEDKKFIEARENISRYEFTGGDFGAILGLIMLIIVAFRETIKVLSKKEKY